MELLPEELDPELHFFQWQWNLPWVEMNLSPCQWALSQELFPSQWDFSVRICTLLIDHRC